MAWSNTVTKDKRGVMVNMSFDRSTADVRVRSYAPGDGRILVTALRALPAVYIRPPSWAPREMVKARRYSKPCKAEWSGNYVRFAKVRRGDKLAIAYPLVTFKQRLTVAKGITGVEKTYTQTWLGNTLVDIEPRGTMLPIFTGRAPTVPPVP